MAADMTGFHVIIPARIGSTRLPRKALLDIAGVPMVIRVAQRVAQRVTSGADQAPLSITIATDDIEIAQVCAHHHVNCVMTEKTHISGTDRVAEAARVMGLNDEDIIVNVQGDEPLIPPNMVAAVARTLINDTVAKIATAAHPLSDPVLVFNPNVVKVVINQAHHALYFSRAAIPWHRDSYPHPATHRGLPSTITPSVFRHYGLYAFRMSVLQDLVRLPISGLEQAESLEQLRFLEHQYTIKVHISEETPEAGVDTMEDLLRVQAYFAPSEHSG